jgi:hypothetical protein
MLASGKSGASIFQFFQELGSLFPVLIESDTVTLRMPSLRYIQSLRDAIPLINSKQTNDFVSKSTRLVLATDGTTTLNSKAVQTVSFYNEKNEWHVLGYKQTFDKCAEGICSSMLEAVDESFYNDQIREKITDLITDRDRTQEKANRLFEEELGRPIGKIPCSMHTGTSSKF